MQTGGRLEDLDSDLLFNVAVSELFRVAELSAESHTFREHVSKAIDALDEQSETGLPPQLDDWGVLPADQMLADGNAATPSPPSVPPIGPQTDIHPGRQMGSFDDLALP